MSTKIQLFNLSLASALYYNPASILFVGYSLYLYILHTKGILKYIVF